jgi:hypothetical protein
LPRSILKPSRSSSVLLSCPTAVVGFSSPSTKINKTANNTKMLVIWESMFIIADCNWTFSFSQNQNCCLCHHHHRRRRFSSCYSVSTVSTMTMMRSCCCSFVLRSTLVRPMSTATPIRQLQTTKKISGSNKYERKAQRGESYRGCYFDCCNDSRRWSIPSSRT